MAKKTSATLTKKGAGRPKKIGGVWHVWRKGFTRKDGTRVSGRWVKAPKGFKGGSTAKKAPAKRKTTKRKAPKRRRNAAKKPAAKKKVSASSVKIAQTRKTAPGGYKSGMGPYCICTAKGNVAKAGDRSLTFRDLNAAKKKLASLRAAGRKGLKLVKVSIPKKKAAAKKPASRKRTTTRRRRNAPKKRKRSSKKGGTVSKKALRGMMKKLGL